MCTKILPITIPPIIGYTVHAFPLSILYNNNECLPWFFSNYIQLVCNTQYEGVFFDFFTLCNILSGNTWIDFIYPGIPWLNSNSIEEFVVSDCNLNINSLVKASLDQNNYIVLFLDEFYVPNRRDFDKTPFYHENLIYGYDTDKMEYDILGFDNRRLFSYSKISFQALEQAFNSNHLNYWNDTSIRLLKINKEYSYELDLEFIRDSLLDYINSKNTCNQLKTIRNPIKNCVYGISVYGELIKYFELLSKDRISYDIRPLHILWEHKKCMLLRIEFISKMYPLAGLNEIYDEYVIIEKRCLTIRQLLIKLSISRQPSIIEKIISTLKFISEKEQEILPNLITKIQTFIVLEEL